MKKVTWNVNCLSTPTVTRHCKKCNKSTEFISSDCFRVNAQGKFLDVWLIYNCAKCKTSWNSTIFSRIHTHKIDSALLHRFHENDKSLARIYGSDKGILKRNKTGAKTIEYEIIGEPFSVGEPTVLKIHCDYPLDMKLSTVLKNKLQLSNARLKQLIVEGTISSAYKDLTKEYLHNDNIVLFNIENELHDAQPQIP